MNSLRITLLALSLLLPCTISHAQVTGNRPTDVAPGEGTHPSSGEPPLTLDSLTPGIASISPNPCNGSTTITFALATEGNALLVLTDPFGREVMKVAEGTTASGEHSVRLRTAALPEGAYLCTLRAEGVTTIWPLVVMR